MEGLSDLKVLEHESIYIIREAYAQCKNMGMLWSIGKDSTTLLWLVRKAFYGKIPFPVLHIDTGYKFDEIYQFRDHYAKVWNLDLIVHRNENAIERGVSPTTGKFECCDELKTVALKDAIKKHDLKAVILGIRRDEHGIRAKERFFSARNENFEWDYMKQAPEFWDFYNLQISQGQHTRVHPLLSWTELDIWKYIQKENIPITDLYLAKNNRRYRSIGCKTCCSTVESEASTVEEIIKELENTTISERSGRAQDKESISTMQKLRSLGYM